MLSRALSDSMTPARRKQFVGRVQELEATTLWLRGPNAETRVIAVTGMGGIGKSTLLVRLLQLASDQGALSIWIDGRSCYRTPRGFWDALPGDFRAWQAMSDERPKLVIAIDNFEDIQVLEGWLREVFMAALPENGVLLLVASRTDLMHTWATDPVWNNHLDVWRLEALSPTEVDEFLAARQMHNVNDIKRVVGGASGHPLTLALTLDTITRGLAHEPQQIRHLVTETVSARIIRELTDPDLQPLVDVLTLVRDANQDLLQRILRHRISARQYHALRQLSFIRRTHGGVGLHDMAENALYEDFRQRDPGSFWAIRHQALDVLIEEYDRVSEAQQGAIAQQLLWLCRDVYASFNTYVDLTATESRLINDRYVPQDRDAVREFSLSWGRQSFPIQGAELLDLVNKVIDHYPETIRIIRDHQGIAQAMFSVLPLHKGTLALLQSHGPEIVSRLMDSGLGISWCEPDASNVSYNILVGINIHQSMYSPQALLGAIARDQFTMHASLLGLLVITDPDLKAFLRSIGYQSMPFPICEDPNVSEELFMLDLRQQHFTGWIRSLAGQSVPESVLKYGSVEELSNALESLGENLLIAKDRGKFLDRMATLLEAEPAPPLTVRDQEILKCSYFPRHRSATACARDLHVSRATYYRHLHHALSHLLAALAPSDKMRQI